MILLEYHTTRTRQALDSLHAAVVRGDPDVVQAFAKVFQDYSRDLETALLAPPEVVKACLAEIEKQL